MAALEHLQAERPRGVGGPGTGVRHRGHGIPVTRQGHEGTVDVPSRRCRHIPIRLRRVIIRAQRGQHHGENLRLVEQSGIRAAQSGQLTYRRFGVVHTERRLGRKRGSTAPGGKESDRFQILFERPSGHLEGNRGAEAVPEESERPVAPAGKFTK